MKSAFCYASYALLLALFNACPVIAVPYASQVRSLSGNQWEFVLNEPADSVAVHRDDGSRVMFVNPGAGRHTFSMAGNGQFEIRVFKNAPYEWTEISSAANLHTHFFRPNGIVVNSDPSSEYFGAVYVSHPVDAPRIPGVSDRMLGAGIYSLSADLVSVDLADGFAARSDPNDATLAKIPSGWNIHGNGGTSPWQIGLDESGNLIASDYSDQHGGIKYASPDLVAGGLVLAFQGGDREAGLYRNSLGQEVHGSIQSKPIVSGTVGVNLTVWAVDEDLDIDGDTRTSSDDAYSLWRWDVGPQTDYDGGPDLEVASTALDAPEALWRSDSIDGAYHDAHYEPRFNKFYLTQQRNHGNESSLIIVTPDSVDGQSPTIEWASKQWSIDNGLDGNDATDIPAGQTISYGEGIQDIFRSLGSVAISPDGTTMYIHRSRQYAATDGEGGNPYLGAESNVPGGVIIVPLDENGLPDIEINNNGTPADPSDDSIANLESIHIEGELDYRVRAPIALDAAGNVYVTSGRVPRLQVFSPGGHTLATTTSRGVFTVVEIPEPASIVLVLSLVYGAVPGRPRSSRSGSDVVR